MTIADVIREHRPTLRDFPGDELLDRAGRRIGTKSRPLAVPPAGERWAAIRTLAGAAEAPWVMEPHGAASRAWAETVCREAGFEPDVRFETDDLQAQIALVESGNAVVVLPDLMSVRRRPGVRWVELPGRPRREVFTSTRAAIAAAPQIVACRAALAAIVPREISMPS